MPVDSTHPDYDAYLPIWDRITDAIAGEDAVKAGRKKYLPRPLKASREKYNLYLQNATYTNYVGYTLDALVGAAFRKPPTNNLSEVPELAYLLDDCDGNGLSLSQLAQPSLAAVLGSGRDGLLVDFPVVDGPYSRADQARYRYRANIRRYDKSSIRMWRTTQVGGRQQLALLTLKETVPEWEDEFKFTPKTQYRVLSLDDNGYYIQRLYDKDNKLVSANDNIRTAKGDRLTYIPFVFIGSQNNDPTVDAPPLLDLVNLNLSMYRNSAEVENMAYMVGMPFLTYYPGKAMSVEERKALEAQTIEMGASKAHRLFEGYKVDFNQISTDSLAYNLMSDKIRQMIQTGARLITDSDGTVKTATQQRSENSATTAILSMCVNNTSDAITQALKYCAHFNGLAKGTDTEIEYQINTNFFDEALDPQVITAQIMLRDNGIISRKDIINYLRRANMLDQSRTIEDIDADIVEDNEKYGT